MRCVRVCFTKLGESKYISHLDLMRAMSRAVRRARLPLWYTEGYNPHPYMSFALPLSLGMESLCETMDIRLEGDITNEQVLTALRSVMPVGIDITDVREPVLDPKKIAFGKFAVTFTQIEDPEQFAKELEAMLEDGGLTAEKLSKKGHSKVMKTVDVSSYICGYSVAAQEDSVKLNLVLPAGSTVNVNPSLVADAVSKRMNKPLAVSILRKQLLTTQMNVFE